MVTRDDIEAFLDRLASEGATYREIEPGLWAVRPGGALDLDFIVHHNPPVVVLRVKVMDLPATNGKSADLFADCSSSTPPARFTDRTAYPAGPILTEALELRDTRLRNSRPAMKV
jgi:hypothetical protein